jgi:(p)ppGpp synthase/HD superfamily hydrolase
MKIRYDPSRDNDPARQEGDLSPTALTVVVDDPNAFGVEVSATRSIEDVFATGPDADDPGVTPVCDSSSSTREGIPMETTISPRLGPNFSEALSYAADLHNSQTRKGGGIPYVGHLLSVSGLVIEAGGTETQAIAGLLHDAAEDQGGAQTLASIETRFGPAVAAIVDACSDTVETPKPLWHERKSRYVAHLDEASDDTILVSLADKVDNARAILRDFRTHGPALWQRFNVHDPKMHMWYYRSLLEVYERRNATWLVAELRRVLDELDELIDSPDPD